MHASEDGADLATPLSLVEWFASFYDAASDPESPAPLEGVVREGELLFVPRGWWHLAINLEVRPSRHREPQLRNCLLFNPMGCSKALWFWAKP